MGVQYMCVDVHYRYYRSSTIHKTTEPTWGYKTDFAVNAENREWASLTVGIHHTWWAPM
jgi:hypothetical protein